MEFLQVILKNNVCIFTWPSNLSILEWNQGGCLSSEDFDVSLFQGTNKNIPKVTGFYLFADLR